NHAHLRACIESILNQTYADFEFIILNDSPENTELGQIVKSYNDARIKYVCNDKNIGISASRNKLIDLARGKYLAIFDHDDISHPSRLERQVRFLDEN
ncbi:MAG: glycosyltransferase family A protein, partial [Pseudomonadota bacterium]|nr:glycosyltransferase family A protein [Pseudomonadota bacterium]